LLAEATIQQDLAAAIQAVAAARSRAAGVTAGSDAASCHLAVKEATDSTDVVGKLTNNGWRYVTVTRRVLDSGNQELSVAPEMTGLLCLGGASLSAVSLSSFAFTGSLGTDRDTAGSNFTVDHQVEYWISGPGLGVAGGEVDLPSSVSGATGDALVWSLLIYVVLPLLDIVSTIPDLSQAVRTITSNISAFSGLFADSYDVGGSLARGDVAGAVTGAIKIVIDILGIMKDFIEELIPRWSFLLEFFDVISKVYSAANLGLAIDYWLELPAHTRIALVGNADGTVTIS
jgi:hypothetical protein